MIPSIHFHLLEHTLEIFLLKKVHTKEEEDKMMLTEVVVEQEIYSTIFRIFPIAIVVPSSRSVNLPSCG